MATNRIELLIEANDKASASLKQTEKNVSSFAKKVKADFVSIAAKVFIVQQAYRAISGTIGGLVSAANRQEDAVNRLNNAMRIQGDYTERLSNKYREFAKEIQRSTRFGDEQVMELMQQLISVGGVTEDQMERAARAAIDFATATGRDLNTAALTVGKAMTGFTGELSRYGIIIDQNIPKTEKARAALEAMERQFGTAAQRDVQTFSGQIAQMSNEWGDLQENLGQFLTRSEQGKAIIYGLAESIKYLNGFLEGAVEQSEKLDTTTGFIIDRIQTLDDLMQTSLELQSSPILPNRNKIEERYNEMLIERQRLMLTLNRLRSEEQEQPQDIQNEVDKLEEQKKSIYDLSELENFVKDDDLMREQMRFEERKNLLNFYVDNYKKAHAGMAAFTVTLAQSIQTNLSGAITGMVTGTTKAKDAFNQLGKAMIETIVNFMAQKLVAFALEKTILAGTVATTSAAAATLAGAWAPAAFLATVATLGGAAAQAPAALASSAAASTAILAGATASMTASIGKAGRSISVENFNPQAEGGDYMVNKPTLFLAGEAGPERATFTPIGKEGSFGDINIFIQGGINPDGLGVSQMAEQLGFEFERRVRVARG